MKTIFLIFIVVCLTEQLKAVDYTAELLRIGGNDPSLATLNSDPDLIVTILNDVNRGGTKVTVTMYDFLDSPPYDTFFTETCNMGTETVQETLAAIIWGSLGVTRCPVKAGDYPAVQKFNITGNIGYPLNSPEQVMTFWFQLYSQKGLAYFDLTTEVHLAHFL